MPSLSQLKQYLNSIGVPVPPDFILEAWLAEMASIEACLVGAEYTDSQKLLIYTYLLGLFAITNGDKYVSSQSAPSGASQSFRYKSDRDKYNGVLAMLRKVDKSGCTADLVPPFGNSAAFFVVTGGCR